MCLCATVAVAQPTINESNVARENAKWYVIRNVETGDYLRFEGRRFPMSLSDGTFSNGGATVTGLDTYNMFYLSKAGSGTNTCHIHTFESELLCADPALWNETGAVWSVTTQGTGNNKYQTITLEGSAMHYNSADASVDLNIASDPNSRWVFEEITDFAPITGLDDFAEYAADVCDGFNLSWLLRNISLGNAYKVWTAFSNHGPQVDYILNEKNHTTLGAALNDISEVERILSDLNGVYDNIISFNYVNIYASNTQYLSTNTTSLTVNAVPNTHTNVWKMESQGDMTYLIYNEATNQYLGIPDRNTGAVKIVGDKNLAGLWAIDIDVTDGGVTYTTIQSLDWTSGYLYIQDAKNVVCSTNKTTWYIKGLDDVKISDALYYQAANMAWQYPYTLQGNVGLVTEACEQYYSNAPSPDESSSTCNLIDGVYTSCFTTDKGVEPGEHYIEADLGAGNAQKEFYLYVKTDFQRTDARAHKIRVEGSNDGSSYTTVANLETTLADEMYYFSPLVSAAVAYRYLRFNVETVNAGDGSFTLSELYILPNNSDVSSCRNNITNFYSTSLAGDAIVTHALALVKMEAEYYLNNSVHSETPAVGEYLTSEYQKLRAAYEGVTENITTIEALATALERFKNSKSRPVFVITSAWEDGFSKDYAVSYDAANGSFVGATANYWDLRQWYAHGSLESENMQPTSSIQLMSVVDGKPIMNAQHASIEAIDGWDNLYPSALDAWNIRLYNGSNYLTVDRYMNLTSEITPATVDANKNAAWYFTYIGTSASLFGLNSAEHGDFVEALAKFGLVYRQAKVYYDNYDKNGTGGLGMYHYTPAGGLTFDGFKSKYESNAAGNGAEDYFKEGPLAVANKCLAGSLSASAIIDLAAALEAHLPNFRLNTPPAGYYYRLKGRLSGNYLLSGITDGALNMGEVAGNVANEQASIFYSLEDDDDGAINILSYDNGRYIKYDAGVYANDAVPCDDEVRYSQNVAVNRSATGTSSYFAFEFGNGNYLLDQATKALSTTDFDVNRGLDWGIELVRELPVSVGAAMMTSICVPEELQIPDGVTAYIVTGKEVADGNHRYVVDYSVVEENVEVLNLLPLECGIIPAGLPVLLKAAEGLYYFPVNYNATDADKSDELLSEIESLWSRNLLSGTHDRRYISEADGVVHHILSVKNGRVGMYKVSLVAGRGEKPNFLNGAHRAWLPLRQQAAAMMGFAFAVGGRGTATDIEPVRTFDADADGVYDLQGRRLTGTVARGVYIVNGKKVVK